MSGRGTHQIGGLVVGLAVAQTAVWAGRASFGEAIALAGTAALTAGGGLSCDVDQTKAWRSLDRWLPDEWLGAGGPLQHRGLTHWPGVTVGFAVMWWLTVVAAPGLERLWPFMAGQVAGWASHLALDAVCGRQVRTPDGAVVVRAGIPLMPWWGHRGGLIRSGGFGSQAIGVLLAALAAVQVVFMAGGVS